MSNKLSTVFSNRKPEADNASKLFPQSVVCQMLHKMEALEGGKFGFVKMIMLNNEIAKKLLNINTKNRLLSKIRSQSYREMMDACVWCVGADALVISNTNVIANGAHRLVAKLESSTEAIPVMVRYGVNWEEFTYIDKQRVRNNATSVGIDFQLDRAIKMFYNIGLSCNQVSVYKTQLAANLLNTSYALSKIVGTKNHKVVNRSTLTAFMLAWQTAEKNEDKHFAINKWRIFNAGESGPSDHEDDVETKYSRAVRDETINKNRLAWKPAYELFKIAYMIFVPGEHHNKKDIKIKTPTDSKFKELAAKCLNTTI